MGIFSVVGSKNILWCGVEVGVGVVVVVFGRNAADFLEGGERNLECWIVQA